MLVKCKCGNTNAIKNGIKRGKQQYQCKRCKHQWLEEIQEVNGRLPRILVFDIETSPIIAPVWGLFKQNISHKHIIKDWFVINWAAKWLFEEEIMTGVLTPKEAKKGDDNRIIKKIWDIFDRADMVIAHNGDRFDIAKLNSRFLKYDFKLPSPYQSIDTLKTARKFRNTSNKLDYLCGMLDIATKIETGGMTLWLDCIKGDKKALTTMDEYCQNDVLILEQLYIRLRPYMRNHPNLGLYMDSDYELCPNCGSDMLKWGYLHYTRANIYECARCNDCGSYMRARKSTLPKEKRDLILT
jgi:ssDNA-binding Zn-finger/Zn-ribbon topoisomerase 1